MLGGVKGESLRDASFARTLDLSCARSRWVCALAKGAESESVVLHIYEVIRQVLRELAPIIVVVERRNPDLGKQLVRAASSILLNVGEGRYSQGRNQGARYHTAMGSANETLACLHVALDLAFIESVDPALLDQLDRIIATLNNLIRASRR